MLQELAVAFDTADPSRCGFIPTQEALRITRELCATHGPGDFNPDDLMPLNEDAMASISFTGLIEQLNHSPWCDALPAALLTSIRRRANQFTAVHDGVSPSPSRTPLKSPFRKQSQGKRPIVHVYPNDGGNGRTGHVELLVYSIPHLLEAATHKLGLSRCARRLFDMDGKEIKDHKSVTQGQEVVVSSGEAFVKRPPDANKTQKLLLESEYDACVHEVEDHALTKIRQFMALTAINGQDVKGLSFFQTMELIPDSRPLSLSFRSLQGKQLVHEFTQPGPLKVRFVDRLYLLKTGLEIQWRTGTNMEKPDAPPVKNSTHSVKWLSEGRNRCVVLFPNDAGVCYDHYTAVAPSMPTLLSLASKKLGLPWGAQRVFSVTGVELTDAPWEDIHSGDELVFSCGENFKPRTPAVRHSKFGSLSFSVDRLDMLPSERNSMNPIVAEGYQHTRTAPFCRTHKPPDKKHQNLGFQPTILVRSPKKASSGTPPAACKFKDVPDAAAVADDPVKLMSTRGVSAQPGSPVKQMLGAFRHMEEEQAPAAETNLPWSEELGQMEVLVGHYHDLLRRQKERSQLENYVKPTLLRGRFSKFGTEETHVDDQKDVEQ